MVMHVVRKGTEEVMVHPIDARELVTLHGYEHVRVLHDAAQAPPIEPRHAARMAPPLPLAPGATDDGGGTGAAGAAGAGVAGAEGGTGAGSPAPDGAIAGGAKKAK